MAANSRLVRLLEREGVVAPRIVDVFRQVDRELFVPPEARREAKLDRPVPIPRDQTTSQPSLIARMIDAAGVTPEARVLEIGTGLGFQTALLGCLGAEVVSVERWPELAAMASANLTRAGITNATVVVGDGWQGWPDAAPYDAVIVSAAAESMPRALGEQLVEGGRLVIPLRRARGDDVVLFRKEGEQLSTVRLVSPARFVPLVRGATVPSNAPNAPRPAGPSVTP